MGATVNNNSIASNRSTLKEFIASIATIQGDLSNITAPPFVLAEHSTVEIPQYWADHPSLFVSPALAKTPEERALRVLKWFIGSLKNQQYAGRRPEDGIKKPLNAFLGELFLGTWKDEEVGETRLISEQVSHHPPITACYLWNDKYGIRAEGFTRQEVTISGSVNVKQKGYAILHIDEYDEDYLIPVPNVTVKSLWTGTPYPEIYGNYSIVSSTGIVSEMRFKGKGFFTGTKHGVEARVFDSRFPGDDLYTIQGSWNSAFTIRDGNSGKEIETYEVDFERSTPPNIPKVPQQDPWESRRAWAGVREALQRGDMRATAHQKSIVEQGQRNLRKEERAQGLQWKQVFFRRQETDEVFERLAEASQDRFEVDMASGIWKIDKEAALTMQRPFHGTLLPTGRTEHATDIKSTKDVKPFSESWQSDDGTRKDSLQESPPWKPNRDSQLERPGQIQV